VTSPASALNTILVFCPTGITSDLPMTRIPFRTQLIALPQNLTRGNGTVGNRVGFRPPSAVDPAKDNAKTSPR
jgi:hypothetical protein